MAQKLISYFRQMLLVNRRPLERGKLRLKFGVLGLHRA
jgi:hypothetical protein